jgi:hypothetical protein
MGQPRFNPLESFLGIGPTDLSPGIFSPASERSSLFDTPRQTHTNIMDRPRPISSPPSMPPVRALPKPDPVVSEPRAIARKAVPRLDGDELLPTDLKRNYLRRGGVELFTPGDEAIPRPGLHRLEMDRAAPERPVARRQTTLPPSMPSAAVSFAPVVKDASSSRPPMQRAASGSSFSRFFHSRRPAAPNPTEAYSSSSGSDKTLVEKGELLKKMAHVSKSSPKSPKSPKSHWSVREAKPA